MLKNPSAKADRATPPGYLVFVAVQTSVAVRRFHRRPAGPVEPLDRRLISLAGVGIAGLGLAAAYKVSGGRVGVPCLLHATTGLDCPLCGTTRMTAALMHGDLVAAWHFNMVMVVVAPLTALLVGYQLAAYGLDRAHVVRLPRLRLSATSERWLTYGLIGLLVVFGVLRNLI